MGSVNPDEDEQHPFTVLVTGFAPFKQDYPVNPSWEIVSSLPEWLPPLRATTTTTTTDRGPVIPPVRLLTHPEPIRVNYTVVRDLVPKLWHLDGDGAKHSDGHESPPPAEGSAQKIDLAIHVGMAGPRLYYSVERHGDRDGYVMPDVDGKYLREDDERRAREGQKWVWDGMPTELVTDVDVEGVLGRWKALAPKQADLRISDDAGHYLCDFIYFSSLAHLHRAGRPRKVLFLHVPSDASEHSVALGRELLLQLVRAAVESEVARRGRG